LRPLWQRDSRGEGGFRPGTLKSYPIDRVRHRAPLRGATAVLDELE